MLNSVNNLTCDNDTFCDSYASGLIFETNRSMRADETSDLPPIISESPSATVSQFKNYSWNWNNTEKKPE